MKWLILIFLGFIFVPQSIAQNFEDVRQKIKTATENKDYQTAIAELDALKKADQKVFELNNYDYLLARLSEKQGDTAAATANYEAVARRNSVLTEYALWHLSQIFRASGNLLMERIYLQKIAAVAPESILLKAINQRLPQSFFESKDYEATIRLLSNQPQSSVNQQKTDALSGLNQAREKQILLGQAYLQSGKTNEAKEIFTRLVGNLPNAGQPDDFALTALLTLDETTFGKEIDPKKLPALNDFEYLRRAQIYQFNRDFPRARVYFQAIVEKFPASGIVPDALYQIGRTFAQEKRFDEAINWFERVQAEFPTHPIAKDALSQTASAFARVNKPKESVSRYQKFIAQYPDAETIDRAYLNIVDVYRDTGANADALKWTHKTQETFRGKTTEALALFAQAKIYMAQNDWANALKDLENLSKLSDLGGTRVPGGTNPSEVNFLKGLVLENLNRHAEAVEVYLSIPDGRNEYYGWRSTERLKTFAANETHKLLTERKVSELIKGIETKPPEIQKKDAQEILRLTENQEIRARMLETLRKVYAVLPAYQKIPNGSFIEIGRTEVLKEKPANQTVNHHKNLADELLFLALYDEAAPELESSQQKMETAATQNPKSQIPNPKSEDLRYTIAVINKRGDHANRAVAYAEPLWKNIPADYEIALIPREQIELLYPAPYADSLLKYAPSKQVDSRILLAIMRQESRFRPDVKSNAAARGLMQFISTTANQIAGELNRETFTQNELYNPPTAIEFGSQYLADLFKIFPNQPAAVAGSYNGGEDNIGRWMARSKTDNPDRYVPEIVFTQSKDYVYKVMTAYRVYQTIYDENLKAK